MTTTRLKNARTAIARASRKGGTSAEKRAARIELALAWRDHYLEQAAIKGDEADALRRGEDM